MRAATILFLAALLQASPTFAAKKPIALEPASAWQMAYDDEGCRLARQFGEGESNLTLYLEQFGPGPSFHLVASGEALRDLGGADAQFAFGPNGATSNVPPMSANLAASIPALIAPSMVLFEKSQPDTTKKGYGSIGAPEFQPTADEEASITWLEVREGQQTIRARLALGSMGKPMAAMRSCIDNAMTHWGIDVTAHKTLSQPVEPKGNPGSWVRPGDYPIGLLKAGAQGIVQFRLAIDDQGRTRACHIQQATNPKGFGDLVCNLMMRRAKFKPALDAKGNPIASFFQTAVQFEIPG